MNTELEPFAVLAIRAKARSDRRRQLEQIGELVAMIDHLSGEMGSMAFVEAVRHAGGYNIEADCMAIERRQRGITTH
ncbi:hypothetical protein AMC83_CH01929 [Rhizobium phaseoli]|uniref:hypothetical protein n=1 Tax=Rhizobium phaseoli TaxID=396 RepID=UPI0007EA09B7|nr:hypothetical protein [Rhizobium phaseoli]ANL71912.1 hypothetical protein AMC83_CH01929 [Rhizobium phaseoli]